MPRSKLFGYSVEHEDGQVVITIEGSMAAAAMQRLSGLPPAGRGRGRGGRGGTRGGGLAMPFPFDQLGSRSVALTSLFAPEDTLSTDTLGDETGTDIAAIFAQGFDRSYDEYDAKLQAYRAVLAAQGETAAAAEKTETDTPASRRKASTAEATS